MSMFEKNIVKMDPIANEKAIIKGDKYRITVLTDRLFRFEYSPSGKFEDRATRFAVVRNLPVPEIRVVDGEYLEIYTDGVHIKYDKKPFTSAGLQADIAEETSSSDGWHYGDKPDVFKGTCRTLDGVNGECELEDGVTSFSCGWGIIDDSDTMCFNDDGFVEPLKEEGRIDIYLFAHGRQYDKAIKDFYKVSGKQPLIPRYALGNWWSRWFPYTEDSYSELMDEFEDNGIPLSVGVLDMDWHITKLDKKYGGPWTGFTWDKGRFPNRVEFMKKMHEKGLRLSLNLHPADGIRGFEDSYEAIADELGLDKKNEEVAKFDASNKKFLDAYFKKVLNPMEDEGVDLWWLDWQQKGGTSKEGFDPLFVLNHYHYIDSARRGVRPMTFSRYAGAGSHRYPIGFSGDTHITWASLEFQPYFTSTSANIGFGWWSHDIGGHMGGERDDDMMARWTELGVFSPIMRLHSTCDQFCSKEPWTYGMECEHAMVKFLRFRHKMIPYLYTMNKRANEEGIPLCAPLYLNPKSRNEVWAPRSNYYFGSELLCAAITSPMNAKTRMGETQVALPAGTWIDIMNGRIYKGGRRIVAYRPIDEMPVFAKAGGILPLAADSEIKKFGVENPKEFEVRVFGGADGSFTMYEDNDAVESNIKAFNTRFDFKFDKTTVLTVKGEGDASVVPETRKYSFKFSAVTNPEKVTVKVNGKEVKAETKYCTKCNALKVALPEGKPSDEIEISFDGGELPKNNVRDAVKKILDRAQMSTSQKSNIFRNIDENDIVKSIGAIDCCTNIVELKSAVIEVLSAY